MAGEWPVGLPCWAKDSGALEGLEQNDTLWLTRFPGPRGGNRLEQPGQTPGDQWATLVTPFQGPPWPRLKMEAMLGRMGEPEARTCDIPEETFSGQLTRIGQRLHWR